MIIKPQRRWIVVAWCCEEFQRQIENKNFTYFSTVGSVYLNDVSTKPFSYCPFCGEKIEKKED